MNRNMDVQQAYILGYIIELISNSDHFQFDGIYVLRQSFSSFNRESLTPEQLGMDILIELKMIER